MYHKFDKNYVRSISSILFECSPCSTNCLLMCYVQLRVHTTKCIVKLTTVYKLYDLTHAEIKLIQKETNQ